MNTCAGHGDDIDAAGDARREVRTHPGQRDRLGKPAPRDHDCAVVQGRGPGAGVEGRPSVSLVMVGALLAAGCLRQVRGCGRETAVSDHSDCRKARRCARGRVWIRARAVTRRSTRSRKPGRKPDLAEPTACAGGIRQPWARSNWPKKASSAHTAAPVTRQHATHARGPGQQTRYPSRRE